jgi:flagellar motility protein MotE (MotC chaperone)
MSAFRRALTFALTGKPAAPVAAAARARVRLIPIVVVAASGLLVLKATGILTQGSYIFASEEAPAVKKPMTEDDLPKFARAISKPRFQPDWSDPQVTGATPAKAEKKPEPPAGPTEEELRARENAARLAQATARNNSPAERAILERLQERRGTLDERTREMELRENMLKAAEKKIDERIGELKDMESRVDQGARAREQEVTNQIKTLVTMYETMKPKDAARVFDRLDIKVLMQVVLQMNPRKMAEVLAAMSPETAEKLTVALATRGREPEKPAATPAALAPGELPRIDQPPAAPR